MLSTEYALALFQHGDELNKLNIFEEQFKSLTEAIISNEEIIKIIAHPQVSVKEKKEILSNILKSFDKDMLHFCYVLIDNGRFEVLLDVYDEFVVLIKKSLNTMVVNVFSATTLSNDKVDELKNLLKKKYNKNIEIIATLDKKVLGGIRLEFEGKVIDSTLKTNLDDLKSNLM